MPATPAVLIASKFAENTQEDQYESPPGGKGTLIDKFIAMNNGAGSTTIAVNLPSDGTASLNDRFVLKSLAVGESYTFPELAGAFLAPGEAISTIAGAASSIAIRASGRELT